MDVVPLHPTFAAEIRDLDIRGSLDVQTQRELRHLIDHYGVLVFRDTGLDDDTHIEFSRIFGYLELGPATPTDADKSGMARRELFSAGNIGNDGQIITDELAIAHKLGDRLWHTDSSFMPIRSAYSLLLAHEVPPIGGDTWFADTRTAYEELDAATRAEIDRLEVVHSLWWSRHLGGFPIDEDEIDRRPSAVQPLRLPHGGSGRIALYIAAHARDVVGMDRARGRALIGRLLAHASRPRFTISVSWQVGDLVMWDNRTTMHRGGEYDERRHRRDLRRTTIRDGEAPLVPDDPFGEMFAASTSP